MKKIILFIILISSTCLAEIRSRSNQLKFDVNSDQQAEMTLNQTGLGVYTTPSSNLDVSGNANISTQLSVGGYIGSANLNLQGTISHIAEVVASDTNLGSSSYVLADSSSDNLVLTLPSASSASGLTFTIKKTSPSNQVWITASENIDGYTGGLLLTSQNFELPFAQLTSNGSLWYILNKSSDVSQVVASDNLEGRWTLNETSGTTAQDTSLNANHGTLQGGATFADNVVSVSGYREQALLLEGTDDGILVPQSSSLNSGNNITISLWLKGDTQPVNWKRILSKINGGDGWEIQVQSAGPSIGFRIDTSAGTNQVKTVANVLDDEWHHYTATLSNGDIIIYLDGQEALNTTYNHGNGFANSIDFEIGYGGGHFKGLLDEIQFFSRVLSASEINAIYQQSR